MFDKLKKYHLLRLEIAKRKKEVDEPIIFLLDYINSLENYFTSSSCAGRIVLMRIGKIKPESKFIFKTHYEVDYKIVWEKILENYKTYDNIWFKQEPFIVHVFAKDLNSGLKMLKIAQKAGLKHSGIISIKENYIVLEIQSTERIETIISKDGKLLINEEYVKYLVEEANRKLRKTREKMKKFYEILKNSI